MRRAAPATPALSINLQNRRRREMLDKEIQGKGDRLLQSPVASGLAEPWV